MTAKPETKIRDAIKLAMRNAGAHVRVLYGSAEQAGLPDLLVAYCGEFALVEVKRPNPRTVLTPLQRLEATRLRQHGGIVAVARSPIDANIILGWMERRAASRVRVDHEVDHALASEVEMSMGVHK